MKSELSYKYTVLLRFQLFFNKHYFNTSTSLHFPTHLGRGSYRPWEVNIELLFIDYISFIQFRTRPLRRKSTERFTYFISLHWLPHRGPMRPLSHIMLQPSRVDRRTGRAFLHMLTFLSSWYLSNRMSKTNNSKSYKSYINFDKE